MKNVKLNLCKSAKAGFNLVEVLVVIAVIGVIAAIAIPSIGNINDEAHKATVKRNALSVASVLNAAVAAGVDLTDEGITDGVTAVNICETGVTPKTGAFSGKLFKCGGIPGEMKMEVCKHLIVTQDGKSIHLTD